MRCPASSSDSSPRSEPCSQARHSSRARHRGSPFAAWKRELPLKLSRQGLLSCSHARQRTSCRARKRGPPPRLDTEPPLKIVIGGLLLSTTQRASSRARHKGPPPNLSREGLVSCPAKWVSSRAGRRAFPLRLVTDSLLSGTRHRGLLSGSAERAFSHARHRGLPPGLYRGPLLRLDKDGIPSGPAKSVSSRARQKRAMLNTEGPDSLADSLALFVFSIVVLPANPIQQIGESGVKSNTGQLKQWA